MIKCKIMGAKILRTIGLTFSVFLLSFIISGCKKDKMEVTEEKRFSQVGHVATNAYDGGWWLSLSPDGRADLLPGGDISYRGTYKIQGAKIKVKTEQGSQSFTFIIVSDVEIREKEYGTVLRLSK
jgi:hypothetical protein